MKSWAGCCPEVVHSVPVVCWFKPDALGSIPGNCIFSLLPHQICSLIPFPKSLSRVLVQNHLCLDSWHKWFWTMVCEQTHVCMHTYIWTITEPHLHERRQTYRCFSSQNLWTGHLQNLVSWLSMCQDGWSNSTQKMTNSRVCMYREINDMVHHLSLLPRPYPPTYTWWRLASTVLTFVMQTTFKRMSGCLNMAFFLDTCISTE